jgi:hypothetical protein
VYYELNFAPSTQWAAYRSADYRSGMTIASDIGAPRFKVQSDADSYELEASLDLDHLSNRSSRWRLGLSAVIEGSGRPEIVLGSGASTLASPISTTLITLHMNSQRRISHEICIDRLLAEWVDDAAATPQDLMSSR